MDQQFVDLVLVGWGLGRHVSCKSIWSSLKWSFFRHLNQVKRLDRQPKLAVIASYSLLSVY